MSLSGLLVTAKAKLYLVGAVLLAVAAAVLRMQVLKNQRDKARVKAGTLTATVHAVRTKEKIIKEQELLNSRRRVELVKQLKKEGEDFEGVDNLTDSNKF